MHDRDLPTYCCAHGRYYIATLSPVFHIGTIAVITRGGCSFCEKATRAAEAGAVAVIFVNSDDEIFTVAPAEDEEDIAAAIAIPLVRTNDGKPCITDIYLHKVTFKCAHHARLSKLTADGCLRCD